MTLAQEFAPSGAPTCCRRPLRPEGDCGSRREPRAPGTSRASEGLKSPCAGASLGSWTGSEHSPSSTAKQSGAVVPDLAARVRLASGSQPVPEAESRRWGPRALEPRSESPRPGAPLGTGARGGKARADGRARAASGECDGAVCAALRGAAPRHDHLEVSASGAPREPLHRARPREHGGGREARGGGCERRGGLTMRTLAAFSS